MSSGCPCPTSARNAELSPLWLPGNTTTSRGPGADLPAGTASASSCANQACRSGRPVTAERLNAASLRAALVSAARTNRCGSSSRAG